MRLSPCVVALAVALAACTDGRHSELTARDGGGDPVSDGGARPDLTGRDLSGEPSSDLAGGPVDDLATPVTAFGTLSANVSSYSSGAQSIRSTSVSVQFVRLSSVSPSTCTTTMNGGCTIWVCPLPTPPSSSSPTYQSAGTVTVSGATSPISLTPGANAMYPAFSDASHVLYAGGTTLTFSAAGATVGAFQLAATAPSLLTLTAPATTAGKLTLDRTRDLTFTWSGGASGEARVTLSSLTASSSTLINCSAAASLGQMTVPRAALALLPSSPTSASWSFSSLSFATRMIGSYQMSTFLSAYGPGSDGAAAIGTLSYY